MPILDAVRRARAARDATRPPVLSVVMPVYNVEAYLERGHLVTPVPPV